jgi:hypothetical protein
MRPGGATREKWRIPDGKVGEEVYCHVWSSESGSPRLCRLRTDHLALVSKFGYVLTRAGFIGSHKISSIMCH